MPVVIDGTTGIDTIQNNTVTSAKIADGAITGADLNGNQTGSAPIYGCRAWCVFDGTLTGTNAPTAGGNVTSVTRNATGDYTINFTTALPDANYSVVGTSTPDIVGNRNNCVAAPYSQAPSTTSVRIANTVGSTAALTDGKYINVAIFR